jgi:hypothetical protein
MAPAENQRDLVKVPETIRDEMTFHWVESMDEVVAIALLADDREIVPVVDSETVAPEPPLELPVDDLPGVQAGP